MLCKKIDAHNTLIKRKGFPFVQTHRNGHSVLLGIGGNIGDVIRRFEHLLVYLARSPLIRVVESAPILKNPPFGYSEQNDFYNSVLHVETTLSPKALLRYVLYVEKIFGRKRLFKDSPRTLDIDILFYENVVLNTKQLILPHHGWRERPSVLIPLRSIRGFHKKMKQKYYWKRKD